MDWTSRISYVHIGQYYYYYSTYDRNLKKRWQQVGSVFSESLSD